MGDLGDFARKVQRYYIPNIQRNVPKLVKKVSLAVDQAVVVGTPVDKGTARSNWIVSINTEAQSPINAYVPGTKGSTKAANTTAALSQGRAALSAWRVGMVVNITNGLDYIRFLNQGSSAQAPAMFVEQAIDEGVRAITGTSILT